MKALLLIGAILGAFALAGTAAATPGNGAIVTDTKTCIESPFATWCWSVDTVTKMTTTSSGNVSYVLNGTNENTVTFPWLPCTHRETDELHVHWLRKNGEEQSHSERLAFTTHFDCGMPGTGQTCISTFELHEANGQVQFQRPDFVCIPS